MNVQHKTEIVTEQDQKGTSMMEKRELYQKKLQAQLDEWRADYDKMAAKARSASADAQLTIERDMKALGAMIEETQGKLNAVKTSSIDAWEDLKEGLDKSWDDLSKAFAKVRKHF